MLKHTKAFSGFSVNNLEKAKEFYSKVLGLTVKDHPMGLLELHIAGNNPIIVYPKPDHTPASFTILNFPVDNIDQTVDMLTQQGVAFEQYDGTIRTDKKGINRNSGGPQIAWFKDPAGNIFSVIQSN